jgi:UDP-N-acetyl-D-mannosaminuronate dehydrogenase
MAYKSNTDDARESPSLHVASLLKTEGYDVSQFDPLVRGHGYPSLAEASSGADLLAILVPHSVVMEEFRTNEATIRASMRTPRVLSF